MRDIIYQRLGEGFLQRLLDGMINQIGSLNYLVLEE
jgi:hypothetical protein